MAGMTAAEQRVHEAARARGGLIDRASVLAAGATDAFIQHRLAVGRWQRLQDGVYLAGVARPTWLQSLHAACLAGGPSAVASHRGAALLWELDGFGGWIVEVTVPFATRSVIEGSVVHRSRRLSESDAAVHRGVPVTCVERTLIDVGRYVPTSVVEMALESALRRQRTTEERVRTYLDSSSGRRRPGAARLRELLAVRTPGRAAGSPAEVALIRCLRAHGLPDPVRQHPIRLRDGTTAVVDLAWPDARLAVEWDGYDVHSGRRAFASDLERQNALLDVGYQLRRYTGDAMRRQPERIVAALSRVLCTSPAA